MRSVPTRRKDTSPWWVGPVPQFWGKPRTFLNPSSCFCHGADPIDGHRKVVGQDQYPALGEVRETAKLLPRGESPWWRDEGRHLLILCLFSIRGMRIAHMHNAKSREHAHTCRKARAIFKLRYKNKTKTNWGEHSTLQKFRARSVKMHKMFRKGSQTDSPMTQCL